MAKNVPDTKYTKYIPSIDRNYNMVMLLGLTINMVARAVKEQVRKSGLTAVEYELLILVKELREQAIPAEMSRILLRTPPAITALLNRMEKSGLVKRKAHPGNKKLKIVVMTNKGRHALVSAQRNDVLTKIIGKLPEAKFRALWDVLAEVKDRSAVVAEELAARNANEASGSYERLPRRLRTRR